MGRGAVLANSSQQAKEGPELKQHSPPHSVKLEIKQTCLSMGVRALQAVRGWVPQEWGTESEGQSAKGQGDGVLIPKIPISPNCSVAVQSTGHRKAASGWMGEEKRGATLPLLPQRRLISIPDLWKGSILRRGLAGLPKDLTTHCSWCPHGAT